VEVGRGDGQKQIAVIVMALRSLMTPRALRGLIQMVKEAASQDGSQSPALILRERASVLT